MSVEVTTLKSGINVVTDTMPHLETASLGVWVASGSRDERRDEHGISHFLEHMAFKGTRRRSARQIAEEIEAVGGDLNAATGAESTIYHARVLKADVPLALDVLADILSEPNFERDEVIREQSVIVQEIGAVADTPDDLVFEHLNAIAFPDQSLGRSILGTATTVRSFDGRVLRDYLARNYRAPDMVVAAAGAVDHAAVVADVRAAVCELHRPGEPAAGAGAVRRRQPCGEARTRAGPYRHGPSRHRGDRSHGLQSRRCLPASSAAECRRGCSRKRASAAACAIRSPRSTCRIPTSACSVFMPAPTPPTPRS